jgi:hypothetical protein
VIAAASVIFGVMLGDVRVSTQKGGRWVPLPIGLRKVHIFSGRTVCGFSGELRRAWGALESLNTYMGANGKDEVRLLEQVKGWVNDLYGRGDPLSATAEHRTEVLVLRTRLDPAVRIIVARGVRVSLPWSGDENPRVRSFHEFMEHIGSGSGIPAYRTAVEEIRPQLAQIARFEQRTQGVVGQIFTQGLSSVITKSPEVTVSPDLDACVLSAAGAWLTEFRSSHPPIRVCRSLAEFDAVLGSPRKGTALIA